MEYRLRVSTWTRRITLRVHPDGGLEVVAPRRTSRAAILRCIAAERAWIDTTRARFLASAEADAPRPWTPPPTISLPAISACWTVTAIRQPTGRLRLVDTDSGCLQLIGAVENRALCARVLRRWLLRQGQRYLPPRLGTLSHTHALAFQRTSVRLARTRWGSCSRQGAISLNAGLLLMPPSVVDYVLLHELCHTREPNHSPAFWHLVAQHCPAYPALRRELRRASQHLPDWLSSRAS